MRGLIALALAGWLGISYTAEAQNVTPFACKITTVTTGGTAVLAITGPVNGGVVWNPTNSTDALYVNQTGTATTTEGGGNYPLVATSTAPSPGWYVIPYSKLGVSVNSADSSHPFGCLYW